MTMTNEAKVSVVVCVKNEENKIKNCLNSIKKNKPDEIMVIDGDSKDKTFDIAKHFKMLEEKNN